MANRKSARSRIGGWSFLIGVILAVLFGAFGSVGGNILLLLVVAGLIVGFLNVSEDEVHRFLMSSAVLIIASAFGGDVLDVIPYLSGILDALLALFVPATIVVAVKHVFSIARN